MAKAIILEGIDGTGKSTIAKLLKEYLETKGEKVLALREPGGSPYYEAIREHVHFTNLERSGISDALTCAGGIAQNVQQARAALENDIWVVSDRSYISNIPYQAAQGLERQTIEEINKLALNGFNYDIKLLLDVPLELAHERLVAAGKKHDRWETMGDEYFIKVRDIYLELVPQEDLQIINAQLPLSEVFEQVKKAAGI